MKILELKAVSKQFGGLVALDRVDLTLNEGEIFGLLGPNGAGKTTLFNCITGYYSTDQGSILFGGREITSKAAYTICRLGISRTFQLVKVFLEMTALENVMVSAFSWTNSVRLAREEADECLTFVGLKEFQNVPAANLTLVNKKGLDLACALASRPKLLMLDEVMAGLTPTEIQGAMELILKIQSKNITVFLIEHVMEAVMPLCSRIMVLDYGKKIAEDIPKNIVKNDEVIKAYLGAKYHAKTN